MRVMESHNDIIVALVIFFKLILLKKQKATDAVIVCGLIVALYATHFSTVFFICQPLF